MQKSRPGGKTTDIFIGHYTTIHIRVRNLQILTTCYNSVMKLSRKKQQQQFSPPQTSNHGVNTNSALRINGWHSQVYWLTSQWLKVSWGNAWPLVWRRISLAKSKLSMTGSTAVTLNMVDPSCKSPCKIRPFRFPRTAYIFPGRKKNMEKVY